MARQTHLKRRAGRYSWRLRIPADLYHIARRTEIVRSLGPVEHSKARQLGILLTARATAVFQAARLYGYGRERLWAELDTSCTLASSQAAARTILPAPLAPPPPGPPPGQPLPLPPTPAFRPADPRHRLDLVIAAFCDEMQALWAPKTRLMNVASLGLFREHQGDRAIGEIGRPDLREFKELLRRLPPNYTKRFPKRTLTEVAALDLPPISAKTVNKNLSVVSSLFTWAQRNGYCSTNPAKGLAVPIRTRPHEERDAFSEKHLKVLFGSPVYTGCLSAQRRSTPGTLVIKDEKYWLPLIALYSGMRLEEIAQLKTTDIVQVDGIWCFSVHGRDGNSLKTPAAERIIPVYSRLTELGLTGLVGKGWAALWPNLQRGSDGTLGGAFSKWFGRYLDHHLPDQPKLTFHSLRHTFADTLKQSQQSEPLIRHPCTPR